MSRILGVFDPFTRERFVTQRPIPSRERLLSRVKDRVEEHGRLENRRSDSGPLSQ